MKTVILDQKGEIVNNCDFEGKYNKVVEQLNKEVFALLGEENPMANSPMFISSKLNTFLRVYKPLTSAEAKKFEEEDLMSAFEWFMKLVSYINQYCVFVPDKQIFCAFATITVDVYNELINEPRLQTIMKSVDDYLISLHFSASASGLAKEKTTITQLQSLEHGHSLRKAMEVINIQQNNFLDPTDIQRKLSNFNSMVSKQLPHNTKK